MLLPSMCVDKADILIPTDIAQQLADRTSLHDLSICHANVLGKVPDYANSFYLFGLIH